MNENIRVKYYIILRNHTSHYMDTKSILILYFKGLSMRSFTDLNSQNYHKYGEKNCNCNIVDKKFYGLVCFYKNYISITIRYGNSPYNLGIPTGTAPFRTCGRGKIPRGDEDGDEKSPAANSETGTGTMLPARSPYPRVYRILLIYSHNL